MIQRREQSDSSNGKPQDADLPCPTCGQAVAGDAPSHPFCSSRCRQIDLGKWLDGAYVISRPIEQRDLEEGVD